MSFMRSNWQIIWSILGALAGLAALGWVFWQAFRRTESPLLLGVKWVVTAACLAFLVFYVGPLAGGGGLSSVVAIPMMGATAVVLIIVWRRSIADLIASPIASLYDDGKTAPDPKPVYSVALAKRKRGDYLGAREAVREQLRKFPADFEGQMLLAEIEAQDLNDLQAAAIVVQRFVSQPDHAQANIAFALNTLADWHLKYAQDREAAQACFEQLAGLLAGTEWEQRARQRIARIGGMDQLLGSESRRSIQVTHVEGDAGLDGGASIKRVAEVDGSTLAAQHVRHLQQHPHDTETRERLAEVYAEHYHRLDLAVEQLEQMIQFPNQPMKQVVKWLNLLADFQVKYGGTYEAARNALERIIALYPEAGAATVADHRIQLLKLEFKGKEKSQTVTPGSYEDDLGLKRGSANQL